jgi:predicted nucleic-acid-binding Zn-ribbon protein
MKTNILGLRIIEEKEIKCGDCNTPLAFIVVTEGNEDKGSKPKSKYRIFGCYKCGGSSFYSKTFEGTTNICPAKDSFDLTVEDTDIDPDNTIISKLRVRRKNELC